MIDKKIIWGAGAIAAAGVIGGALMYSGQTNPDIAADQQAQTPESGNQEIIDLLYWDELRNKDKYSFCLGTAKIESAYAEPVYSGNGSLKHNSRELLVYNKETKKLYIMAREIEYNYNGSFNSKMGALSVNVPVAEKGSLSEAYSKTEMPIRADYANNYIAADPGTKTAAWVSADMGGEVEMAPARTGCAGVYPLNAPGQTDLTSVAGLAAINRDCAEKDISGAYDGSFSFECQPIGYDEAQNIYGEIKTKEALPKTQDANISEIINIVEDGGNTVDSQDLILDGGAASGQNAPDAQKALDEIRREMMDASQTGQ